MADKPTIAIFAGSAAIRAYLGQIAAIAGADTVDLDKEATLASLVLGAGDQIAPLARNTQKPVLWLGDSKAEEGVRVLKNPLRAGTIIEAIQKILGAEGALPTRLEIGGNAVDTRENLWLQEGEAPVRLTEKEVAILAILKESAPSTVSRQTMLEKVWAYVDGVETHTLETHIYRLRQKIETDPSAPQILLTAEDGYKLGV